MSVGADRQRLPVALAQLLQALKQSAVDEDAVAVDLEQMFRSGDGARRAEKRQRHAKYSTCPPVCQNSTVWSDCESPVADTGDEAGHGLRGVHGIEQRCLRGAPQLERFGRRRRRNAVPVADVRVVDLDLAVGADRCRLRAKPLRHAVEQIRRRSRRSDAAGSSALTPMTCAPQAEQRAARDESRLRAADDDEWTMTSA